MLIIIYCFSLFHVVIFSIDRFFTNFLKEARRQVYHDYLLWFYKQRIKQLIICCDFINRGLSNWFGHTLVHIQLYYYMHETHLLQAPDLSDILGTSLLIFHNLAFRVSSSFCLACSITTLIILWCLDNLWKSFHEMMLVQSSGLASQWVFFSHTFYILTEMLLVFWLWC